MFDETAPNNTKRLVPMIYYDMFAYRLMGLTYGQIAEKTGHSESRIKHIFAKGGVLHELWQGWLDTARQNSVEEAKTMMYGHLPDIIRARIMHAKSTAPGAVESSRLILGYIFGSDTAAANANLGQETEVQEYHRQMILKAFNNFGLIKTDNANTNPNNPDGQRDNPKPETAPGSG